MRQIRRGVFETNSSSVHTLTMCMKDDYDKWARGEVYYNRYFSRVNNFVTKEEAIKILMNSSYPSSKNLLELDDKELEEYLGEEGFDTYDNYGADYEWFETEYTTPNGETVIAFGYSGYDG